MKFNDVDGRLLARYLADECTAEETQKVEQGVAKDVENAQKLKQFKRIWDISEEDHSSMHGVFDTGEQWQQLQSRLEKEGELNRESKRDSFAAKYRSASVHSMTQKLIRVAAIFLIAGLIGVFAYQNWYEPKPEVSETVLREVSTANAQRVNLRLADGTEVMLNADSDIKFPNQFDEDIREVYLMGEAYFDVATNSKRPFVIHSRGAVVRVLGTAFTVRSYEEDRQVQIVVEEGKVSVEDSSAESANKALLTANEMGSYSLNSNEITTSKVDDIQLYLSWKKGYLKFRDKPMKEVALALERRYGVEVSFQSSEIRDKQLTAFLKSRSIKNVLNVIAMSLDVEYELTENRVIFTQ
ncbi:FecR family protein [Fodinibius halophilus]|uniref:DUF4974 domain-containing protein n=1 Tax=Fodinibius halophilus TaxID=1736908 RepID=A0A6M1TID3_9BACT|nr:FecR domain-containing protein [Fodinibius halophilus]NGP89812.1 DUF4974 domain-containing protein [Fodinibius halophilus]